VTRLRFRLSLLVLLAVAGCGGDKTVTVTDISTSATPSAPTPAAQFHTYLTSMKKAQRQWNHADRLWQKDDPQHYYDNTTSWPAIGRKLVKVRGEFDDAAVYVTGVTPPAGLLKANREWISSAKLISAEVDSYVTGFEDKDAAVVYRLDNNQGRLHQIGTLRTAWRIAVLARAKELGVKVPPALMKVGTGY
jgi:hypothetical protein